MLGVRCTCPFIIMPQFHHLTIGHVAEHGVRYSQQLLHTRSYITQVNSSSTYDQLQGGGGGGGGPGGSAEPPLQINDIHNYCYALEKLR